MFKKGTSNGIKAFNGVFSKKIVYYKGTEKDKFNSDECSVVNKILRIIVQFSVKPKPAFAVSKFGVFCCAYILVNCRGPPLNLLNLPQRK